VETRSGPIETNTNQPETTAELSPLEASWARLLRKTRADGVPLKAILTTIGLVVAAYLLGKLFYGLREVVLLFLVGGFVALVLNPQVQALQRWGVRRRGLAVLLVSLWAVAVFLGLAVAFGYPLVNSLTDLANHLPRYIDNAQHGRGWIGHLVRRYHIASWVQRNSPKLTSFAESLGKPALTLGKGAVSVIAAVLTTFVFVVLLLLEAPKMRRALLAQMSPARAEHYRRLGRDISRGVTGYMTGDILTSIVAGVVVFITLAVLGVPYPLLWGLWVALVDFLPSIGGALAGIPTVLFALTQSLRAGVVTAVVFLVYTQFENHVLNPAVMSRTVRVNPLLVFVSVVIGASFGAWIGGPFGAFAAALLAIPVAGAMQVIAKDLWGTHVVAAQEPSSARTDGPAA
jgi:predicted PurR-regulated permease PerM